MALGYEGFVKLGTHYVLGTGASAPRTRPRLDSSSGYGGRIKTPVAEIGIGTPHNYDYITYSGSVSFDVSRDVWKDELKAWLFDRQAPKEILFSSRDGNVQFFEKAYFTGISLSASEGNAVDGTVSFVAPARTTYTFGSDYVDPTISPAARAAILTSVKFGQGLLCPLDSAMPPPLNTSPKNRNPVPYWNTQIWMDGSKWYFLTWSLDFSQDIPFFYGCEHAGGADPGPQEPVELAAGPMTIKLTGDLMNDVIVDDVADANVYIADEDINLKRVELQNQSDDVQSGDSLVVQAVEYEAFEIAGP